MTPSLPIFIPQVLVGQDDYNRTIYEFSIYDHSTMPPVTYTLPIIFIPTDSTAPFPNKPTVIQDLTSNYYFLYTVQDWVNLMNNTLEAICATLVPAISPPPFFSYNVNTCLLQLFAPQAFFGPGGDFDLYCNPQLETFLDSFSFTKEPLPGSIFPPPVDYYFNIGPINGGQNTYTDKSNIDYWVMSQESTTIGLLNPIKSIVFSAGLFPIHNTLTTPPQIFASNTTLYNNGNNSNLSPIFTDFEISLSPGSTYKETIEYVPTGEYRLVDMFSESPVGTLQLIVTWKDNYGNSHPFQLNSGCTFSVKIMFRRKDYGSVPSLT